MKYTLKKADDDNQIITYGKLQKEVDSFMADYAYTTDLTQRPNFCFVGGTLIHTDKGLVPIKDIKVGDLVLSKDESGEGELVYKPVTRTIKTENVPVCFATFTPESVRKVPFSQRANLDLYADILCTSNHPFWIEGKGWIAAEQMEMNDNVLLQDGSKAWNRGGRYEGKGVELVFKTDKTDVGFVPDFGGSTNQGRFVDLNTGRTIRFGSYTPVYKKLHAVRDLWHNPTAVQWEKGEGPVTTTVYNFEVADTHTYFVGEHGVWVHNTNCGSPKVQQGMAPILPEGGNGKVYWARYINRS
ncbi:Hint domain-containing protein [Acinetobacter sp.]|uniref:Hint domain-containing protein n=1 Tax=Acinetobacter sp. TaxID=472 RepID=UPI003D02CBD3